MKPLYMPGEARKLQLIHAILNIDNEAVLSAIETIVDQHADTKKKQGIDLSELLGTLTEEEAEAMKKVIEENFERINPDDWK